MTGARCARGISQSVSSQISSAFSRFRASRASPQPSTRTASRAHLRGPGAIWEILAMPTRLAARPSAKTAARPCEMHALCPTGQEARRHGSRTIRQFLEDGLTQWGINADGHRCGERSPEGHSRATAAVATSYRIYHGYMRSYQRTVGSRPLYCRRPTRHLGAAPELSPCGSASGSPVRGGQSKLGERLQQRRPKEPINVGYHEPSSLKAPQHSLPQQVADGAPDLVPGNVGQC